MLRGKENIFGDCLSVLLTAAVAWSALFPFAAPAVTVPAGDLAPYGAPDGQLNTADILVLQRFVLGELQPSASELRIGDVAPLDTPDGILNAGDLVVLMRAVLGEITLPDVTLVPNAPVLNAGISPTNANPHPVTGTSEPGLTIDLYVNGRLEKTATAAADGRFGFNAVLIDGINTLYVTATDAGWSSVPSNSLSVDYINTIPRIQNGVINQDTVWTPGTGAAYIVNGELAIDPGVTLSIQPGTAIKFDGFRTLNVNGNLDIRGGPAGEQVRITSLTNTGLGEQWFGIQVNAGGYATIDFAVIENANTGIWFNSGDGSVSNTVIQLTYSGIETTGTSAPHITGNTLTGNTFGILAKGQSRPVITGNNQVMGNDTGIAAQGNAQPRVNENNILNNTWNYDTSFHLGGEGLVLDAARNYWGSGAPAQISVDIYDNGYSSGLPFVGFTPFLTQPNTGDGQLVVAQDNFLIGPITADLTLPAGSTYQVVGNVRLAEGKSLVMEPGVTLRFHDIYDIRIDGNLQVQGTPTSPVLFTSAIGTNKDDWSWIEITALSSAANIDHAVFEYADTGLWFNGGTGTVTHSEFRNNTYGIDIFSGSSVTVSDSRFIENSFGTRVRTPLNTLVGPRNTFIGNGTGVWVSGSGRAGGNPAPVVRGNNLVGNTTNYYAANFFAPAGMTLDARLNWWGSTNSAVIDTGIYDAADNPAGSPVVQYQPVLGSPVGAMTVLPPLLNAPPAFTNRNPLTVSGNATPDIEVWLWVDGVQQAVTNTDATGSFTLTATLVEGVNNLYITGFDGSSQSAPSPSFNVMLDTVAPVITLTNPVNGGITNTAAVTGRLNEPASLVINGAAVAPATDHRFAHPLSGLSDGPNTFTLLATDPAGNSTAQTVNFSLDTVAPNVPDLARVSASAPTAGQVSINGTAGSAETAARVSLTNSRSGETQVVTAAADGSFTLTMAAQAGDNLVLLVGDAAGNSAPARLLHIAGGAPVPGLSITDPFDGISVMSDAIAVEGLYQGPANTGIRVNGITAVTVGDHFCADGVALLPGPNTLTVTVISAAGASASQSITVTSTGPAPLRLETEPAQHFAPATVTFSLTERTGTILQTLDYDFDGDGTTDTTSTDPALPVQYTYSTPGCYTARITATDDAGGIHTATRMVVVQDAAALEGQVKAVWYGMLSRLRAGNVADALSAMTDTMKARYETVFVNLGSDLSVVVDKLGTVTGGGVTGDIAELIIAREEEARVGFKVYLVRDHDGLWYIAEM